MSPLSWKKYREVQEEEARRAGKELAEEKKASRYLEFRDGARGRRIWRVNCREYHEQLVEGRKVRKRISLRHVLKGPFKTWKEASQACEEAVYTARYGKARTAATALVRCEDLVKRIMELFYDPKKDTNEHKTWEHADNHYRCHIVPWLNEHCPYAKDLTALVWVAYKVFRVSANPRAAIRHDRTYFAKMMKLAVTEKILDKPFELAYDPKKEDKREEGKVIPAVHMAKILEHAPRVSTKWLDRIIVQRKTCMRPGETRKLRKDRVTFHLRREPGHDLPFLVMKISLKAEDVKTRDPRSFYVRDLEVIRTLCRRHEIAGDSPYYFTAQASGGTKPMGQDLGGFESILDRAGLDRKLYTPHDFRHTGITELVRRTNQYAQICEMVGMSLEELDETYCHLNEDDTLGVAGIATGLFVPSKPAVSGPKHRIGKHENVAQI
jgi:integrase